MLINMHVMTKRFIRVLKSISLASSLIVTFNFTIRSLSIIKVRKFLINSRMLRIEAKGIVIL